MPHEGLEVDSSELYTGAQKRAGGEGSVWKVLGGGWVSLESACYKTMDTNIGNL